jgi:hypothetical protein
MVSFAPFVVLARIAGAVLGCGASAVLLGFPVSLRFGGLTISATNWRRLAAQALVLLLTAEVLDIQKDRRRQARILAVLLGVFTSLSLVSSPTRVGDGFQYMAMALTLADISPPALSQEQLDTQSRALAQMAGFEGDPGLRVPALVGTDGCQDFPHFWFYPLLASPWIAASRLVGVHPNAGFTALNCGLLLLASFALLRRSGTPLAVLIAVSPIVWWLDKAHTEVFSFSLLTIAILALREAPWWSLICLGMASTQNPPFALAFLIAAVFAGCSSLRADRRLWLAGAAGGLLCLLHPAYYQWHLGRFSPLAEATTPNMPTLAALVTPLWDPSLGILVHFPGVALLLALCLWCVARDRAHRVPTGELAATGAMAAVFLLAFTQTGNVNSAGTPHPSRYGLWLVPVTIPALAWTLESLSRRGLLWIGALVVAASGVYSAYAYQPKWPEQYLNPTPLAGWLWTRWPTMSNPLPEVFVERVSGVDSQHTLPVATAGCEKILLAADERGSAAWPLPCRPEPLPAGCREPAALCYASRTSSGYAFTRAPRQAGFTYELATFWTWSGDGHRTGHDVFSRAGSVPMEIVRADKPESLLVPWESSRMRRTYALRGEGVLLAWFEPADQVAASVSIVLPSAGTITVIDPVTNLELVSLGAAAHQRVLVSLPNIPATALVARFR